MKYKHSDIWKNTENCTNYNWSEGGGSIIKKVNEGYEHWCVPQYGGEPVFDNLFKTIEEVKKVSDTYT